jgi:hypothetical protein
LEASSGKALLSYAPATLNFSDSGSDTLKAVVTTESGIVAPYWIAASKNVPTSLDRTKPTSVRVYKNEAGIGVVSPEIIRNIRIYDLQGRILYDQTQVNATDYTVRERFNPPVLIVQVITETKTESVKVKNEQ